LLRIAETIKTLVKISDTANNSTNTIRTRDNMRTTSKSTKDELKNRVTTPWSRVFIKKLIVAQLVKKFTAIYGTQRFITAFT
jgi:hypothetical protein